MARSRFWYVTGIPFLVLSAVGGGCSDDETIPHAPSGNAGAGGNGAGGIDNPGTGQPKANFGRACQAPSDCGVDLLCLTSSSTALSRGGPPGGLCTIACRQDPEVCSRFADDARCVDFGDTSYCLEACDYGSTIEDAFDAQKCHGRTEFACKPRWVDTGESCDSVDDCSDGERCDDTCYRDMPTCMPQCNGDSDCDTGRFCDPRSGECVSHVPGGRRLTERCNVETQPDPCRGSCGLIERDEGGRCDETCTLGAYPNCGLVPDPPNLGCAIPVNDRARFGDMGFCAPLCDCTVDCPDGMVCVVAEFEYLQRPGFCKSPEPGDRIRSSCESTSTGDATSTGAGAASGTGGSGGSGGNGGVGGSGGQAGAPAEGGAAGAEFGFW